MEKYLEGYEKTAQEAVQGGLILDAKENFPVSTEKCEFVRITLEYVG